MQHLRFPDAACPTTGGHAAHDPYTLGSHRLAEVRIREQRRNWSLLTDQHGQLVALRCIDPSADDTTSRHSASPAPDALTLVAARWDCTDTATPHRDLPRGTARLLRAWISVHHHDLAALLAAGKLRPGQRAS